jgi:uroporphyrinogen-III synthase
VTHEEPLCGARVVVTRAGGQAGELGRLLAERGAEVISLPVIAIVDPESFVELDRALGALPSYDWTVFLSVNAVAKTFARADALALEPQAWRGVRVAAVGPATARALLDRGARPEVTPHKFGAIDLARALGSGPGKVLLPRVAGAPRDFVDELAALGWDVDEVTAYRNVPAEPSRAAETVRDGSFDVVTFTSPSTVRNFVATLGAPQEVGLAPGSAAGKLVACIGPQTASAARELGVRVDVVAAEHTAAGMAAALACMFSRPRG